MTEKLKRKLPAVVAGLIMLISSLAGAGVALPQTSMPDDFRSLREQQQTVTVRDAETDPGYDRGRLIMLAFGVIALLSGILSAFLVGRIITGPADLHRGRSAGDEKTEDSA